MDAKTRKALEGSITKWRKIVKGTGINLGVDNCPLCRLFYDRHCKGCPVMKQTGRNGCDQSPYPLYEDAVFIYGDYSDAALLLAQAELDFLISLRPKKSGPSRR